MSRTSFRLVSESRLQASRAQAQDRLAQWCREWGLVPAQFRVEVSRFAAAPTGAAASWRSVGDHRWLRLPSEQALQEAVSAALFGASVVGTATAMSRDTADAAIHAYEPAVDLGQGAAPANAATQPTHGTGLVLIALSGPGTLLEVVQRANEPADAATSRPPALPALQTADLDAALRGVPAQPTVELGHTELALAELLDLRTGQVVVLDQSIHHPLRLSCDDSTAEVFAHLGRQGERLAVQITRPPHTKDTKMNKDLPSSGKATAAAHVQIVDLEELPGGPVGESAVLENRISLFGGIKARVTAVVGHTQSSVGELLALKEGATFKLDRHVDAPVDLIVEGRVIARGQLSVIDDQFAVHVTEVIQAGLK